MLLQKVFLEKRQRVKRAITPSENTCSFKRALDVCRYPAKILHQISLQFAGTTNNPTVSEIANPVVKALRRRTTILIALVISNRAPLEKTIEAKMVYIITGMANCGAFARKTLTSQIFTNSQTADTAAAEPLNGLPGADGLWARARVAVHMPKRVIAAARQIAIYIA